MQDFFLTIQNKHMGTAAECGDCRNLSRCRKQSYQRDASHEAESECGVLTRWLHQRGGGARRKALWLGKKVRFCEGYSIILVDVTR